MSSTITLDMPLSRIPYSRNWVGAWAMHEPEFAAMRQQLEKTSITAHLADLDARDVLADNDVNVDIEDGVAVIEVNGPMMKHASSFGGSCSTVAIRRTINKLSRDPDVLAMVLKIESPGGTVAGTQELADDIKNFGKPTLAFCSDLTASAGYWIASQCDTIAANEMALVGSIGVYSVAVDSSRAAEQKGFVVHVIKAGEHKGDGVPGTEITEEQLAHAQSLINSINVHFSAAVMDGRKMTSEQVAAVADGRVHMARDAMAMGLVDSVESYEVAFENFVSSLNPSSPEPANQQEKISMADSTQSPVTVAQLKERFPKSTAAWREKAIESGWTIAEAADSYLALQEARAEAAEERAAAAERRASKPGLRPVRTASSKKRRKGFRAMDDDKEVMDDEEKEMEEDKDYESMDDDPESMDDEDEIDSMEDEESASAVWRREVAKASKETRGNRQRAVSLANKRNPGLRAAMVQEANAMRRVRVRR